MLSGLYMHRSNLLLFFTRALFAALIEIGHLDHITYPGPCLLSGFGLCVGVTLDQGPGVTGRVIDLN